MDEDILEKDELEELEDDKLEEELANSEELDSPVDINLFSPRNDQERYEKALESLYKDHNEGIYFFLRRNENWEKIYFGLEKMIGNNVSRCIFCKGCIHQHSSRKCSKRIIYEEDENVENEIVPENFHLEVENNF